MRNQDDRNRQHGAASAEKGEPWTVLPIKISKCKMRKEGPKAWTKSAHTSIAGSVCWRLWRDQSVVAINVTCQKNQQTTSRSFVFVPQVLCFIIFYDDGRKSEESDRFVDSEKNSESRDVFPVVPWFTWNFQHIDFFQRQICHWSTVYLRFE